VAAGVPLEQLKAQCVLAPVKGGGGHIYQQLCLLLGKNSNGICVIGQFPLPELISIPGIFTDGYSQAQTFKGNCLRMNSGIKVTALIKYIIGRQQRFSLDMQDISFID